MNSQKFDSELKTQLMSTGVDISFLGKWFDKTLEQLQALNKQRAQIGHPRLRGDARETDIRDIIRGLFPPGLALEKGFALNRRTAISREQDVLVCDANTAGAFIKAGDSAYYPIESCLASIEVKSELTLPELRKSIISCVTLKKLLYGDGYTIDRKEEQSSDVCYAIFAYAGTLELKDLATRVNILLAAIPEYLRPNLIYVLGKGLLIPGMDGGLELTHRQMFCGGPLLPLPGLGTTFIKKSESYAFLWFVASIVDHCLLERQKRAPPMYLSYALDPICRQSSFEKMLKEQKPEEFERIQAKLADDT